MQKLSLRLQKELTNSLLMNKSRLFDCNKCRKQFVLNILSSLLRMIKLILRKIISQYVANRENLAELYKN